MQVRLQGEDKDCFAGETWLIFRAGRRRAESLHLRSSRQRQAQAGKHSGQTMLLPPKLSRLWQSMEFWSHSHIASPDLTAAALVRDGQSVSCCFGVGA